MASSPRQSPITVNGLFRGPCAAGRKRDIPLRLTIFVEEPEGYTDDGMAWESESTNSMAASVSDIDVSGEGVTFRLEAGTTGNAEVTVYSVERNISYVFNVEVKGGEMLLTDSRWEPYEADDNEEETEETETGENRENT